MGRPRHEYEPLLVFKFFKGPEDLRSGIAFFAWLRRDYLGKMVFFGNFFKIAETHFGIFFLQDIFISETYSLIIKRFWKAADKLAYFYTIYLQLS